MSYYTMTLITAGIVFPIVAGILGRYLDSDASVLYGGAAIILLGLVLDKQVKIIKLLEGDQ